MKEKYSMCISWWVFELKAAAFDPEDKSHHFIALF